MYLFSVCLFQHSKNRVYVLFAFLPGAQRLYIVVNGPSTNRKLIWQELADAVEIREAESILKTINPANREVRFQLFGTQELWHTESKRNKAFFKRAYSQRDMLYFRNSTHRRAGNITSKGARLKFQ